MSEQGQTTASRPSFALGARAWALRLGLINLPFLILVFAPALPGFIQVLVVGAAMFFAPGFAWTNMRQGDAPYIVFRWVVAALVVSFAAWLVAFLLPGPTDRVVFIVALAALSNVGLWLGVRRNWWGGQAFSGALPRALAVVAAIFFLQCYLGAAHFVPALEDQDMETQGTAYGLMNEAQPTMVLDRGGRFFFAHPLLLHFWIGESALLSGDLDRLKYYHDQSLALAHDPGANAAHFAIVQAQFEADPVLVPTRTPNIFLSILTLFPLGFLAFHLTRSRLAAVGACVIYATFPEIYVRSSYGGYLAVTNFLLVSGIYAYLKAGGFLGEAAAGADRRKPETRVAWAASFLSGAADQKGILLPFAIAAHAGVIALLDARKVLADGIKSAWRKLWANPNFVLAFSIGVAFICGWIAYALYGLSVSPSAFIEDHIKTHIVRRMNLEYVELAGKTGPGFAYPSVVGLWLEYFDHSGWIFAPVALAGIALSLKKLRGAEGVLLLLVAVGAIGFSLVDWRQTKHLAHLLPAYAVFVALAWSRLDKTWRNILGVVLVIGIIWNVWRIVQLMLDFLTIQPAPIW